MPKPETTKLSYDELIKNISAECGHTKIVIKDVLDTLRDVCETAVKKKQAVSIPKFFVLKTSYRKPKPERDQYHPQKKKIVRVAATPGKYVPTIKILDTFKDKTTTK